MEKIITELKKEMFFKETTNVGDAILFLRKEEDEKIIMAFGQILNFTLDENKKDEWWHVDFLFFDLPPTKTTITLQKQHFTGAEVFTMGGREVFIKALDFNKYAGLDKEIAKSNNKEQKDKRNFTLVK